VFFLPPRADVQFYYAAADAYVGPSIEDAFALPPAEAMACGLPVIVSRQAGVSEWVTPGVDGLILEDPKDADELSKLIRSLVNDPLLCLRLGENAATTARQYTWARNAAAIKSFLELAIHREGKETAMNPAGETHDD
jgi:UDP-glucose:(heptosyl)LPS alpha-1,3-glucosyltransferase